jgi:PAS domain-containing protein
VPIIEKKKTVGLRGIIIDITEYKRTEADLIKSNELYRMVVENAGDLIIIIKDGYIKYVN